MGATGAAGCCRGRPGCGNLRLCAISLRLQHARVGSKDHEHLSPFHASDGLDDRDVLQVADDPLEHLVPEFPVAELAASKHHRDACLVGVLQEFPDLPDLDVVVVRLGPRAQLDLLQQHHHLLLLGLVLLLLLRVLELPVIHDLADGRLGERAHLDEVEAALLGRAQRLLDRQDAELLTLGSNASHLSGLDAAVGARVAARPLVFAVDGRSPVFPSGGVRKVA